MPGNLSDYSAQRVLDEITLRGTATSYLALLNAQPSHDTAFANISELTYSGYARQSVTWSAPVWDSGAGAWSSQNSNAITFGPFSVDMTQVSAWAVLVDSSSGTTGNILYDFQLDLSIEALAGTPISVAAGDLKVYSA